MKTGITAASYASWLEAKPDLYTPSIEKMSQIYNVKETRRQTRHTVHGVVHPVVHFVYLCTKVIRIEIEVGYILR